MTEQSRVFAEPPVIATNLSELADSHHRFMIIKWRDVASYQRPMIATDLADAASVAPVSRWFHPDALVALLICRRIPFASLRVLFGTNRIKRAMENTAREHMYELAKGMDVPRQRFELALRDGDIRDHIVRELEWRTPELLVLAFENARVLSRLLASGPFVRLFDSRRFDLVVIRPDVPSRCSGDATATPGPL